MSGRAQDTWTMAPWVGCAPHPMCTTRNLR
jgi:hypothetical protein